MRRSHTPNDREGHLRLVAGISAALAPAADAWVEFITGCRDSDRRDGYEAFWAGPDWFARELGELFFSNEAGRGFEGLLWNTQVSTSNDQINSGDVLRRERESLRPDAIDDCLNPVDFLYPSRPSEHMIGIDARAMAHVAKLLDREDRHFEHEIEAAAKQASHSLPGLGQHTPEPHGGRSPDEARPPRVRDPSFDHFTDRKYWYSKYWHPVDFASEYKEFTSRRWYAVLIPLIAPEFVLNKALSAPGSAAYAIPTEADWTWAIIANTADRMCTQLPELVLLHKNPKTCNGDIWRPPSGKWLKQGWTHYILKLSVRGIEVDLMWLVRHWRRVIRFYQPLLIDHFASRGETLLPVMEG